MNPQAITNIHFYESRQEIGVTEPYAILPAEEMVKTIKRFVSWATMIATHPDLAKLFGEESTAPIQLATDLRAALNEARLKNTYPNVVLPTRKFTAAMTLMSTSRQLEPVFAEMLAREDQRWPEDLYQ
jgi:hypothetical protein